MQKKKKKSNNSKTIPVQIEIVKLQTVETSSSWALPSYYGSDCLFISNWMKVAREKAVFERGWHQWIMDKKGALNKSLIYKSYNC